MKNFIIRILKEAGQIQLGHFSHTHHVNHKESISSIVTDVDLLCDRAITDAINLEYPSHNIISEEGGMIDKGSEFTWVIDPLDGTSNYAGNIPWFGVLIALFREDVPVIAGAYLPVDDKLYLAEAGLGASLNNKRLLLRNVGMKDQLMCFSSDFTEDEEFLNYGLDIYRFLLKNSRNIRSTNSLLDLIYVAEGKLGGAVNLFNKIWDIAAPYLIIREAGGEMRDIYGNTINFSLSKENILRNYPIMAGTPSVIKELTGRNV
jgi:myo-inositol-1(or 4)-monophosphatase